MISIKFIIIITFASKFLANGQPTENKIPDDLVAICTDGNKCDVRKGFCAKDTGTCSLECELYCSDLYTKNMTNSDCMINCGGYIVYNNIQEYGIPDGVLKLMDLFDHQTNSNMLVNKYSDDRKVVSVQDRGMKAETVNPKNKTCTQKVMPFTFQYAIIPIAILGVIAIILFVVVVRLCLERSPKNDAEQEEGIPMVIIGPENNVTGRFAARPNDQADPFLSLSSTGHNQDPDDSDEQQDMQGSQIIEHNQLLNGPDQEHQLQEDVQLFHNRGPRPGDSGFQSTNHAPN